MVPVETTRGETATVQDFRVGGGTGDVGLPPSEEERRGRYKRGESRRHRGEEKRAGGEEAEERKRHKGEKRRGGDRR